MQIGVRMEESWSLFRPYRWLAERSVGRNRRKLIHRESFRASVLHHSEIQAVLEKHCGENVSLDNAFVLIEGHPLGVDSFSMKTLFTVTFVSFVLGLAILCCF